MDHKDTSKAIVAFVVLSVIVHGIIAYVIVKTNDDEQIIEPIELADQNELNQNPEYQKLPAPKKPVARKKPRIKKQRVEKPAVEVPRVEAPRAEAPPVETADVEKSSAEDEAVSQKTAESEKEVLSDLPDTPLAEESDVVVDTAGDEKASEVDGSGGAVAGGVVDSSDGGTSSGESDAAAIQELKKVTEVAEEQSVSEAQVESKAASGQEAITDSAEISAKKSQALKPNPQKKYGATYRVNQVQVIRPTNFRYPQVSRRLKEEGTAILRLFFNKNGSPQKIELVKSTGSIRLDDAARQGASTLRLKSLGHAFIYELPVRFQLDFTDQQLNESIDFLAPNTAGEGLGKFRSKAQSR